MTKWTTSLHVNISNKFFTTPGIDIKRGLFQGDSLSPLWFCLALNPLSNALNNTKYGFRMKSSPTNSFTLSHLLYIDDIKIYASNEQHLKYLLDIISTFSNDICMQFGLDKCRLLHIEKGKIKPGNYNISHNEQISSMEANEKYKYLGFHQSKSIDHKQIKIDLTAEFNDRLKSILKTELNARNIIKAINTFAIPALTYSFGVIKWSKTEITGIERSIRTSLTKYNLHHPKAAIERMSLPRYMGGRGLIDIQQLLDKQIHSLQIFFHNKSHSSPLHKSILNTDNHLTPLNLKNEVPQTTTNINKIHLNRKVEIWAQKELHGRHLNDLNQPYVDKIASNKWLSLGEIYAETEGFMIAIQDQVIHTKNYAKYIIKDCNTTDDKCRRCFQAPETIQHIISGCKLLANTEYLNRHNQVAKIIHQKLAHQHKLINTYAPYYKYSPETILENATHKLYYDLTIQTDKTIVNNRPDITLIDKKNKTCYLVDIAVPLSHNVEKTITEKVTKYQDLAVEIKRIWNMEQVYIVPIVISATGIVPKQIQNSLKTLNLNPNTYIKLQKSIIISTCHIARKFLNSPQQ